MSKECCCYCHVRDGHWNQGHTLAESFQHVINFPQRSRNCNGHKTRRPWYYHPIYNQYWEQYDVLQQSFKQLLNPLVQPGHHHHGREDNTIEYVRSPRKRIQERSVRRPEKIRSEKKCKVPQIWRQRDGEASSKDKNRSRSNDGQEEHEEGGGDSDIDEDFLAFKITSEKFKREREMKKEASVSIKETECSEEEERKHMRELYGENAHIVAAMMQAENFSFKRYQDAEGYKFWPDMPLSLKFT